MVSVKLVVAAFVLAALAAAVAEGQSTPSCAQKLEPCVQYLNGTSTPSEACCSPLREMVANEKACLCTVYKTPGFLASLGVNSTQVAALAMSCGVNADANTVCSAANAPSPTVLPSTPKPPSVMAGGDDGSASRQITGLGLPSIILLAALTILCI
ncbi:hypothetical protein SAY87_015141 [Trapa incisa]|uniref:Bifunctional inhibitor/plant lipid transfer protein/seed storage helical domain-containing protein n=1 Tax=Trapa incisa TaxID=236973 RepID=A0AAN7JLP7_9MYRT|nr:hypothetical protein SAY87_015141 [Trapa incisa]